MINIVDLVEKMHNIDCDISKYINKNIELPILDNYKNNKILLIGFSDKYIYKYDHISSFKISDIEKIIKDYNLVVINEKFSELSTNTIQELIDFFKKTKVNSIILGYSSYINLNVDNHKYMFRPIDITKYPYKINTYKIIESRLSKNYTIKLKF